MPTELHVLRVFTATDGGRPISIRQGRGSILDARPGPDGSVEIGGRCVLDDVRPYR